MSAIARGTEAIERELDAVLAQLAERAGAGAAGGQGAARPPASRRVVAALPRRVLDEAALEELGRWGGQGEGLGGCTPVVEHLEASVM